MGPPKPARRAAASLPAADLDAVVEAAERESGAPRELLGSYVATSARCAEQASRLTKRNLAEFRSWGELAAERGVELRRLLDLYLSATWRLSERLTQQGEGGVAWATPLFRASDDAAAALGEGYERAQRRAIRREEAIRRELIDDLLAGVAVEESHRDLASHVGFNLAGVHHAVVARTDRAVREGGPVQAHVEREVLAAGGDQGFVTTKEARLVCVLPGADPSTAEVVSGLVGAVDPGPWVVGVGRPHAGPGGVARSFREALDALEMAERLGLRERVVRFVDLLPFRVVAQDQQLLRDVVDDVLGPLEGARGGAGPLIETLEAYFDEALSATATARRVHLSVRAVTYRLERIASLTGRSLRDPRDRFALEVAVRGRRLLGGGDFADPATSATPNFRPGL